MRVLLLPVAFVLAAALVAQTPADPETAVRIEIAKTVQRLDAMLEQAKAAEVHAREGLQRAQRAAADAKGADLERLAVIATDLHTQLQAFANTMAAQREALQVLRDKASVVAPASLIDPLEVIREQVVASAKLPTLTDALATLEKIEKDLTSDTMRGRPGVDRLLPFVRYRLAETLRQSAMLAAGTKNDHREGERLLVRASKKFAEVCSGEDSSDSGEGTSLHAAALRRIVQVEGILYEAYKQLSAQQPATQAYVNGAKEHRKAANEAFDKLRRIHAEATLPDGTKFIEAAKADAGRFRQ